MEQSPVTHSNRTESGRGAESTADLLRRLLDDASTLIHKELALVKTEVSEALSEAKVAAISMATGGGFVRRHSRPASCCCPWSRACSRGLDGSPYRRRDCRHHRICNDPRWQKEVGTVGF